MTAVSERSRTGRSTAVRLRSARGREAIAGFGFLARAAGFDIGQRLIPYAAATSTYLDAFWVGLLNTLLVSGLAIGLATLIGFAVGIARLSPRSIAATGVFMATAAATVFLSRHVLGD